MHMTELPLQLIPPGFVSLASINCLIASRTKKHGGVSSKWNEVDYSSYVTPLQSK